MPNFKLIDIKCPGCKKVTGKIYASRDRISGLCKEKLIYVSQEYREHRYNCCDYQIEVINYPKENFYAEGSKTLFPEEKEFETEEVELGEKKPKKYWINLNHPDLPNSLGVKISCERRVDIIERQLGRFTCISIDGMKFFGILLFIIVFILLIINFMMASNTTERFSDNFGQIRGELNSLKNELIILKEENLAFRNEIDRLKRFSFIWTDWPFFVFLNNFYSVWLETFNILFNPCHQR